MSLFNFNPVNLNGLVLPCKCLYYKNVNGFYVPCGKCEFCRRQRAREWAFRLEAETNLMHAYNCLLTYSDEYLPYYKGKPSLNKVHVQLFMKRLRYYLEKHYQCKVKYFLCGEYGGKRHRPHYHLILFSERRFEENKAQPFAFIEELFSQSWKYGICDIEPLNNIGGSVSYLTSYMLSYDDEIEYDEHNKPFLLMSRCGLGKNWIEEHPSLVRMMQKEMNYSYRKQLADGRKVIVPLPRYLRRKITDEAEQIARADAYYEYCADFKEFLREIKSNKETNLDYGKKLKQERTAQRQRERDAYRKNKIHANNANTSKLSHRAKKSKEF